MHRSELVFDSRFAVPAEARAAYVNLYLMIDGRASVGNRGAHAAPLLMVLADDEYEAASHQTEHFRTWGRPCAVVDLRLQQDRVRVPVGLAKSPQPLATPVVRAARGLLGTLRPEATREEAVVATAALLQALADAGVVHASVAIGSAGLADQFARFLPVWVALQRFYARHETSPYLELISELTGRSLRQLDRDFRSLCDTFGLHGNSFRATARVLRLRRALLLLSAPDATPGAVATAVGYGSVEALDRAFRDAGLPAPRELRSQLAPAAAS